MGFSEEHLHFIIPPNLSTSLLAASQNLLAPAELPPASDTPSSIKWATKSSFDVNSQVPILSLHLPQSSGLAKQIVWHRRGDYFASLCELPVFFCPV